MPSSSNAPAKDAALAAHRCGSDAAIELLEAALGTAPLDGDLLIAHAAACGLAGQDQPFQRLERVLRDAPDWIDGHKALAQLRTEFGNPAPLSAIETALERLPRDPRLWMAYFSLLAAAGRHDEIVDHVERLRSDIGDMPALRLLQARHLGFAGRAPAAKNMLADLPDDVPELQYERARNAMRLGELDAARTALDVAILETPQDIGLWALIELCWRATGDLRHAWLMHEGAIAGQESLELDADALGAAVTAIESLHRTHAAPLGQSLKHGTQTRGDLRWREEDEIRNLFRAIEVALTGYAKKLAALPADHPLVSLRTKRPEITASWSVRLTSGGHHVSHLHNSGLISSALHLRLPEKRPSGEGVLELGRPPDDIPLVLAPFATFAPRVGHLVLFPSFLYHGTTPIGGGTRLTVAFDAT